MLTQLCLLAVIAPSVANFKRITAGLQYLLGAGAITTITLLTLLRHRTDENEKQETKDDARLTGSPVNTLPDRGRPQNEALTDDRCLQAATYGSTFQ